MLSVHNQNECFTPVEGRLCCVGRLGFVVIKSGRNAAGFVVETCCLW